MAVFSGVALLLVLTVVGFVAREGLQRREQQAQVLRTRWREQNVRALLTLSTVGRLSVEDQAKLDGAGEDPERMRQVLVRIHEDRLADAAKDLEDAQQRKVELQGGGGYKVYADQPQAKDLVALANQDEWTATTDITRYAEGLRRVRMWQPVTYGAFVADAAAASPAARPVQEAAVEEPRTEPQEPVPVRESVAAKGPAPARSVPAVKTVTAPSAAGASGAVAPAGTAVGASNPEHVAAPATSVNWRKAEQQSEEAEIRDTLRRWAEAMVLNDPQAETAEYAPHLQRYFLRTDVDQAFVLKDKLAYWRRGNRTASFALENVHIENETDTTAEVRLVKDVTWSQSSSGATHKLIRSELWLVRTGDGWKITGERDFR